MNQRDIRTRIFAHHFSIEFTPIAKLYFNHAGVINHVVVGDDVPLRGVNNYAGTQRHEFLLLTAVAAVTAALAEGRILERRTVLAERGVIAKELLEITRHTRRIHRGATFYINTDHRWHHFFEHRCQAWHLLGSHC
ncbi:Uncharacterised protein [Salmonella enterica subsp. enterica serovar Bovismorbificans]|uniref:Uncharacterized protein n=1 Tax=Salmonella enterica subsp. enterica serovar Bovismorbificans TaxID=58097 RepID=A0A655DG16_SALET|nr:Uncharacterised protein [Salmonella enterica subsp. enterica serovar Bovismorbificans]